MGLTAETSVTDTNLLRSIVIGRTCGGVHTSWVGQLDSVQQTQKERDVIILGIVLLVVGYFTGISILYTIGGVLLLVGVVLWILGAVGRPVGGRRAWY